MRDDVIDDRIDLDRGNGRSAMVQSVQDLLAGA